MSRLEESYLTYFNSTEKLVCIKITLRNFIRAVRFYFHQNVYRLCALRFWSHSSRVAHGNRKSFTGHDELFLPWRRKIAGNFPLARRIVPCIRVYVCVDVCMYTRGVWRTRVSTSRGSAKTKG